MRDYREIIRPSGLYERAHGGLFARVAVLDSGIPAVDGIIPRRTTNFAASKLPDPVHSTFVGSILFGRKGIHGICPEASAYFGNVFSGVIAEPDVVARAIDCASGKWRADVINLSLGFSRDYDCPKQLRDACRRAYDRGSILVAAAGNDGGNVLWPAALPEVICVGSVGTNGKAGFSNSGEVDFVGPGTDLEGYDTSGNIISKSGTSFSAALVSGLIALLVSEALVTSEDRPDPAEIKSKLVGLCSDLGDFGWDTDTGNGIPFLQPMQKPGVFDRIVTALRSLFRRK